MSDAPKPALPPADPRISNVIVASLPYAFTQTPPLDTGAFIDQAKRRGHDLDLPALHDLYRHRLLIPLLYVSTRPASTPVDLDDEEPWRGSHLLTLLRAGRNSGRLVDLAEAPYKPWIKFEAAKHQPRPWWNGLLYSQHQLLALPRLENWLASRHRLTTWRTINVYESVPPPRPDNPTKALMGRYRRIAAAVSAFEAVYLPNLDREWLRPVHVDPRTWDAFRESFDPSVVAQQIGYTPQQAKDDAEWLLIDADHVDPITGYWRKLIRRAPRDQWDQLKGKALVAIDARIAAEILMRFYEDMADRGLADPLPQLPPRSGAVLHDRLSHRDETLSADLMHLGLAPQPRVVLALEGETEAEHMPLVWKALGYPEAPELVQMHKLGGVDNNPVKIGGHIAAPLISRKDPGGEFWHLIKPPTCFMLAVDPEGKYYADNKYANTRQLILAEIRDVLKIQGADGAINDAELDVLVEIHRWTEACYEFEHFTDPELADGLIQIHHTVGGLTRDQLIARIAAVRATRKRDIKEVWSLWGQTPNDRKPSKVDLAKALWPVLEAKIFAAKTDPSAPVPAIAEVVQHAFYVAQNWRYKTFVLTANTNTVSTQTSKE